MRIQSDLARGAGAVMRTVNLVEALELDSVQGELEELNVLMAARSHSWFFLYLCSALAFQSQQNMMDQQMRATTPMTEAPDAKLAHWKLKMALPSLTD